MLKKLLSTGGQYKYSMYKKSDPEFVGPPVPTNSIRSPELLQPSVTKSAPTKSPKSLLGNYSVGRLSIPVDPWQAKRNLLQSANPHVVIPGAAPGVQGISIGRTF